MGEQSSGLIPTGKGTSFAVKAERVAPMIAAFGRLASAFGQEMDVSRQQTYMLALGDLDPELLMAASLRYIERATYARLPTVGELRENAAAIITEAIGIPAETEAWGLVQKEISRVGSRRPSFKFAVIMQAVEDVGGWRYLGYSDNPTADRARFIDAYRGRVRQLVNRLTSTPASELYREQLADSLEQQPETMKRISGLAERMRMKPAKKPE